MPLFFKSWNAHTGPACGLWHSIGPRQYVLQGGARLAAGLLEALGVEKAVVVGHSARRCHSRRALQKVSRALRCALDDASLRQLSCAFSAHSLLPTGELGDFINLFLCLRTNWLLSGYKQRGRGHAW